jgi:hypothetical protein
MYNIVYSNHRITFGNVNLGIELPYANITYSTVEHGTIFGVDKALIGSTVTVTATPSTGYTLTYITVNGTQIEGNSFVVTENATVGAVFTGIVRSVTTTSSPAAGGSVVASPNTGIIGTEVTLSNTPAEGYNFNGYTISGATLSGNILTIGESDVAVTGKFISAYGYYITTSAAACSAVPISSIGHGYSDYYIPIIDNMNGPYGYGGTFSYSVSWPNFYAIASKVYDGITALTINVDPNCILSIGDNTFNNLTSLTLSFTSNNNVYVGNNSLNNVSGLIAFQNSNYNATVIGDNSCSDIIFANNSAVTSARNNINLKVGVNSLKKFAVGNDSYIYLPSGNIGADLTVAPLVKISANRLTLKGDVKTCMYESAIARGATLTSTGNLKTAGYVIDYQGTYNNQDYRISCPDATADDIRWLNGNKSYFVTGNSYKSYVEFTN